MVEVDDYVFRFNFFEKINIDENLNKINDFDTFLKTIKNKYKNISEAQQIEIALKLFQP